MLSYSQDQIEKYQFTKSSFYFLDEVDECRSNPCENGICEDQVNAFSCNCSDGWDGLACDGKSPHTVHTNVQAFSMFETNILQQET